MSKRKPGKQICLQDLLPSTENNNAIFVFLTQICLDMKDPYLLHIFNPTKNVSPFDVNMAYEAEFDGVIPYSNVTLEEVHALTQDTIFSRGPKGVKRTGIFIGGRDFGLAIDMFKRARTAMVPPFEVSVFADPSGAVTTAAALVACVEYWVAATARTSLENRKVCIFGGTGPVGTCTAVLLSNCNADVHIASHRGEHVANEIAEECNARFNTRVKGKSHRTEEETTELINSAEIIIGAAKAGVRLATAKQLSRSRKLLVAADVNAVPPAGFEGVDVNDYGKALPTREGTAVGVGALAIGDVKYKVHKRVFEDMLAADTALYYGHAESFQVARTIVNSG